MPTFLRGIYILQKKGMVPKFKIDGRLIKLMFSSPFAKSQNTDDVLAFTEAMQIASLAGPQHVSRSIKVEDIPGWVFGKKGVDATLVRTTDEKAALDEKTAQAASAAAQAGAAEGGVDGAVKAVSGLAGLGQQGA